MTIYARYWKKYRVPFLVAVSCVFLEAMCDLLQPTIMAQIIDRGVKYGLIGEVLKLGFAMLAITLLGACFAAGRNILAGWVSQNFGADLRHDLFAKIMRFSEISADKIENGSLITRMTNDTSQITQFVNGMMRVFFKAPLTCVGSIVLAVMLSPQLSLYLLGAVAIVAVLIAVSMQMSYQRFAKVQYAIDKVNMVVEEYILGVRLVKAFGRYENEEKKFGAANTDLSNKTMSSQLVIAWFSPVMSLMMNVGTAAIVYAGSLLFASGAVEVGRVSAFINYMAQILSSLIMITNVFNTFVRTKASTERVNEIINSGEDFVSGGEGAGAGPGSLAFDGVTFSYPGSSGTPAVRNLSFEVGGGETLAVIGPTGSGKSTLAWLCLRFYDTDGGAITLGGVNIREMDCRSLRRRIALAPQKSMLFTGTVYENIAWGNPAATEELVADAAKIAQADGFIRRMPGQYQSVLGQGGVNLSGGQKQRISMARALAADSDVILFDDCTSALDAVTEAKVRSGLKTLHGGKTIILITQRIGTAMLADKILVLDNGEKSGLGTHEELMRGCRTYREIYQSQIGGE